MKRLLLLILSFTCLISVAFTQTDTEIINGSVNFSAFNGIQGLLHSSNDSKMFVSFTGDEKMLEGKMILLLKYAKSKIQQNGIWAGIGFGGDKMAGTDFVFVQYSPNSSLAGGFDEDVVDAFGSTQKNQEHLVYPDQIFGNNDNTLNNVVKKSFLVTEINLSGYLTRLEVNFTKDLSKLDAYDWKSFQTWKTNKGKVMGTWGWFSSDTNPLEHAGNPSTVSLVNGFGLSGSGAGTNSSTVISISAFLLYLIVSVFLF